MGDMFLKYCHFAKFITLKVQGTNSKSVLRSPNSKKFIRPPDITYLCSLMDSL